MRNGATCCKRLRPARSITGNPRNRRSRARRGRRPSTTAIATRSWSIIRDIFSTADALARDEVKREIARALGYDRVGSRIADVLDGDLRAAVRRGILENRGGELRALCRGIGDYTRDHLMDMLLSDIGRGWWERDDLMT